MERTIWRNTMLNRLSPIRREERMKSLFAIDSVCDLNVLAPHAQPVTDRISIIGKYPSDWLTPSMNVPSNIITRIPGITRNTFMIPFIIELTLSDEKPAKTPTVMDTAVASKPTDNPTKSVGQAPVSNCEKTSCP